jgi:hypothetical protein
MEEHWKKQIMGGIRGDELSLYSKNLDGEGATFLAAALHENTTVTRLYLAQTNFWGGRCNEFSECIERK